MKLYQTYPSHFISYTPLITATLFGVSHENVYVAADSELAKDDKVKAMKAHWNWPVLELPTGHTISQSVAVARFIALEAGRTDFIGNTPFEQA